jgi:hypothetical protein
LSPIIAYARAGDEAMTRDEQRKACIKAQKAAWISMAGGQVTQFSPEDEHILDECFTAAFDALHGIACVEGILLSSMKGALLLSGDILTNPPETK